MVRGQVNVVFTPSGSTTWKRQQETIVSITAGQDTEIYSVRYLWTEEFREPDVSEYDHTFSGVASGGSSGPVTTNCSATLDSETGNDWYLWVRIEYDDLGVTRSKSFRSEPFYIDNIAPSAIFEVDEIHV